VGRIAAKKKALALLSHDLEQARSFLLELDFGLAVHILFSGIIRSDRPLRWHAIEVMGEVVARHAEREMEAARVVMRRLLWNLNDESGGIGWGSPETMAEVMARHGALTREYLPIYVSYLSDHKGAYRRQGNSFIEHTGLQQGLLWGIGRLAGPRSKELAATPVCRLLPSYLQSDSHQVRALAARALGLLQVREAAAAVGALVGDDSPVELFEDHRITIAIAGQLAAAALQQLQK